MEQQFTQTGGIRYGKNLFWACNFTNPFAQLCITRESIVLDVSFPPLWRRRFTFPKSDIRALHWKRGLFSTGLQIEHAVKTYPPFISFWTFDRSSLGESLKDFGYEIS